MKCYAIKKGRKNNVVVDTWDECKDLVVGCASEYKSFGNKQDAYSWLGNIQLSEAKAEIITILASSNMYISGSKLISKDTGEFIELY